MRVLRVTVEPADRQWQAVVQGVGGSAGVRARDLADVEPRVRRLLATNLAVASVDVDLDIDVRLPAALQHHLFLVESISESLQDEITAAVDAMRAVGLPELDIARILADWYRPPRALTITNEEIVDKGLDGHPSAIGIRWDDHGFALTLKCRAHVEATRHAYRDAPPEEWNALVYPGEPFVCDLCHEGDELHDDHQPQAQEQP